MSSCEPSDLHITEQGTRALVQHSTQGFPELLEEGFNNYVTLNWKMHSHPTCH